MMKRILVIQTASIGDVILATAVLEKLHAFYPETSLDLLIKNGMEGLFHGHPYIHQLLIRNKQSRKIRNFLKLAWVVRQNKYDLIINLQRFFLSGLLTAFSGARMRIGFDKNPLSFFYTQSLPHVIKENVHEIDRNLSLIKTLTGTELFKPVLYPSGKDFLTVSSYKTRSYYTISPASLWFTKQYPAEKWVDLILNMPSDHLIYLLGAASDQPLCDQIIRLSGSENVQNLSGRFTLLESAAIMKDAKMNFTNDSSPMHLASAMNAPVTAVFCSTIPGFGFGPLSDDSVVVEIPEKLNCRPCGLHGHKSCPEKHFKCALNIPETMLMNRC